MTLAQVVLYSTDQPRAWDHVADILSADDFLRAEHRAIWSAAAVASEDGEPLDAVTLAKRIRAEMGPTKAEPACLHLSALLAVAGTPRVPASTLRSWARQVRRRARVRSATAAASALVVSARDPDASPDDLMETAQARFAEVAQADDVEGDDAAALSLDRVAQRFTESYLNTAEPVDVIRTGFATLDQTFPSGLRPGTVTLLAALTSRGKTSLAIQVAERASRIVAAQQREDAVLFVSLEMHEDEITARRIIAETGVELAVFERRAPASGDELHRLAEATPLLRARPFLIERRGECSIGHIRALARRMKARRGLELLVVDYVQLVSAPDAKGDSRTAEVDAVSRGLKMLAMDLDVPVLALAQLNRQAEGQAREPMLKDLRESGALEQNADNVLFIYSLPKDPYEEARFRVGKQRQGPRDVECKVRWRGRLFRFEDLATPQQENAWT